METEVDFAVSCLDSEDGRTESALDLLRCLARAASEAGAAAGGGELDLEAYGRFLDAKAAAALAKEKTVSKETAKRLSGLLSGDDAERVLKWFSGYLSALETTGHAEPGPLFDAGDSPEDGTGTAPEAADPSGTVPDEEAGEPDSATEPASDDQAKPAVDAAPEAEDAAEGPDDGGSATDDGGIGDDVTFPVEDGEAEEVVDDIGDLDFLPDGGEEDEAAEAPADEPSEPEKPKEEEAKPAAKAPAFAPPPFMKKKN